LDLINVAQHKQLHEIPDAVAKLDDPRNSVPLAQTGYPIMGNWYDTVYHSNKILFPSPSESVLFGKFTNGFAATSTQTPVPWNGRLNTDAYRLHRLGGTHARTGQGWNHREDPNEWRDQLHHFSHGRVLFPPGHPMAGQPMSSIYFEGFDENQNPVWSVPYMQWGDQLIAPAPNRGYHINKRQYSAMDRGYGTTAYDSFISNPDVAHILKDALKTDNYRRAALGSQRAVAVDTHDARIARLPDYFNDFLAREGFKGSNGKRWDKAQAMMADFLARESSYAAAAARNRAGGEIMGIPGHAFQASTWGPRRALGVALARNDWDPIRAAHDLTNRDIFYAGSYLPIIASGDWQHRVRVMANEGLVDVNAPRNLFNFTHDLWPSEQMLNQVVGGPHLVPEARSVLQNMTKNFENSNKHANWVAKTHYITPEEEKTSRPTHYRRPLMDRILNTRRLVDRLVATYPKDFHAR
jgi:hypothetical protein